MDTTIRDSKGNAIATLWPQSYIRCMVFLQGEKSLHEYAEYRRAQATEQEAARERSKERKEKGRGSGKESRREKSET